ncbi:hypothetical protein [Pandoraea apista]|uniref:hypothetical protein n=1 Tax=Pandoraea apista TaxID=93218 RepID=UPI000F660D23|nr:hypothetical protein [Pandoraea apista]RRW90625.1 hypothetical protein EGJ54_21990 [Pandoraea apista]RRX00417.1 hypothetical protein EGJ56_19235 [Pandoraea apista]
MPYVEVWVDPELVETPIEGFSTEDLIDELERRCCFVADVDFSGRIESIYHLLRLHEDRRALDAMRDLTRDVLGVAH